MKQDGEGKTYEVRLQLSEPQLQVLLGAVADAKDCYLDDALDKQMEGQEDSEEYSTLIWLYGETKALEMQILSVFGRLGIQPIGSEEV